MSWLSLHIIALLFVAAGFGAMLCLMICFAPTVFRTLERPQASKLMRNVFSRYYFYLAWLLGLAAAFLVPGASYGVEISLLASCVVCLMGLRHWLLPHMDRLKNIDQPAFNKWHRISVSINMAQLAAVFVVLVRLAQ